jgi:hypothetical protein
MKIAVIKKFFGKNQKLSRPNKRTPPHRSKEIIFTIPILIWYAHTEASNTRLSPTWFYPASRSRF